MQLRRTWAALAASTVIGGVVWITACASVPADARIGIDAPSAAVDQFGPVGDFLTWRCGSLDCHGTVGRNFRVWGCDGMRLQPGDIPECIKRLNGRPTTADEYQETYRSLVALEPAVMSFVVDDGAKHPELLTFIRKSRGEEMPSPPMVRSSSPTQLSSAEEVSVQGLVQPIPVFSSEIGGKKAPALTDQRQRVSDTGRQRTAASSTSSAVRCCGS